MQEDIIQFAIHYSGVKTTNYDMYSNRNAHEADTNLLNKIVSALTQGRDVNDEDDSLEKLDEQFCVEDTLTATDIKVTVNGVGELSFPLSKEYVHKLIEVSTTAEFGMGEETVLDKNVRDTQMIGLDVNQESLIRITNNIREALGLPADSTLSPHLYNMLIYGPGQFFDKHRDSEELQNIIATLVIVLPSPHVGGDLIIERARKKHIFSTENVDEENVKWICFYSDCLHNVNKVKCGYRIALTFNVVLETEIPDTLACTNEELKIAVRDYFNAETVGDSPRKIIFFLNHAYSEHSLLWNLLKGEDWQYASSFRLVARVLDLHIHLALAKIHQKWSWESEYEPDPDSLIETDSTLTYWIDANNVKLPYIEYSTKRSEICFSRDIHYANFAPTKEDFSGPTGNAGATVDYWYKRATVVLWRKSDSLMVKFELNYDEAMTEIGKFISVPGNEKKVIEILNKATKLSQKSRPLMNNFKTFVSIALYIMSKEEAQTILSPFRLNVLIPKNVKMLIQLQQQYGTDWLIELLGALRQDKVYGCYSSRMKSEAINPFIHEFLNSGGDRSVIGFLLNAEVTAFTEKSVGWNSRFHFRCAQGLERAQELFEACETIGNAALQKKLAQYLTSQPKLFSKSELVKLHQQFLRKSISHLQIRLIEGIKEELASHSRDVNDWSLSEGLACYCKHCNVLVNFLRARTVKSITWPANETTRKHVMSILKRSGAPVDVTVNREGRPFSMVLVKSATLHTNEAAKRAELKELLKILEVNNVAMKRQSLIKDGHEKRQKL